MISVTTESELRNALNSQEPEIRIANSININSLITIDYSVMMTGVDDVCLFWVKPTSSQRKMIIINSNGHLTINTLIFDAENRDGTLVHVIGGTFTMNEKCILRNIKSTTASNAVRLGDRNTPLGGTFIMNHGLITNITAADVVYNHGGKIFMNNDAAIHNNMSAGVTMEISQIGANRPLLIMTGTSTISENQSNQGASAGITIGADIIMGVYPEDAPSIKNNKAINMSIGGWYLTGNSSLIMRYNSEISGNFATSIIGGLALAMESTLAMFDNAIIKDNHSDAYGGGVVMSGSSAILHDNAQISNNSSLGNAGGVYLQNNSTLELKGNSQISGNKGLNGGGILVTSGSSGFSTVILGSDNSSPRILMNQATEKGGGIYVAANSHLNIMGRTLITNNEAEQGKGIYKLGPLNLSGSIQILDGLYYDKTETDDASLVPSYTENVPRIVGPFSKEAQIQLEQSSHIAEHNIPLVIAEEGSSYSPLEEIEQKIWLLPANLGTGCQVVLSHDQTQVWLILANYTISYTNLYECEHSNPTSYGKNDLPITLVPPTKRRGYVFTGWQNEQGEIITIIPQDTEKDLVLSATWKELFLIFNGNTHYATNVTSPINAKNNPIIIPHRIPCLKCYRFLYWYHPITRKIFFPGNEIAIEEQTITLFALWQPLHCQRTSPFKKGN